MKDLFVRIKKVLRILVFVVWQAVEDIFDGILQGENEGAQWGKITDIAQIYNKGLLISKHHHRLSRKTSYMSVTLCGPTGSGKSSSFLIPQLLILNDATIIVTDPSKEIFYATSGFRACHSTVLTFNLSNWQESVGFNILALVKGPNDIAINTIADMFARSSLEKGGNADPFWALSSRNVLTCLIRLVMYEPIEKRHMASVAFALTTLSTDPQYIDYKIVKTKDSKLIDQYKSILSTSPKTLQSILATTRACLQCFDSEDTRRVTSINTLSFKELRTRPYTVYIHHNVSQSKTVSNLISLFFEMLYTYILDTPTKKDDVDLAILLEETANNYIPILSQALSMTRKTRTMNFLCIQSQAQLKSIYHDEYINILENTQTKIFLPGISAMETLQQIEALGGKARIKDKKTGNLRNESLISLDAIRTMKENTALVLSGRNPIIRTKIEGYFKNRTFRRLTSMPSVSLTGSIPDQEIPMIEFESVAQKPSSIHENQI